MRSLSETLDFLQKILIEPPPHIRDVETRHKSRLLNIFLLPTILVFLGVDAIYLATLPGYMPPWYGYVFLFGSYFLNRSRYYRSAAFLTLVMFPIVIMATILSGEASNPVVMLYYLIPGLILAGILLSQRVTLVFALIEVCVILSMPRLAPDAFAGIDRIVGPLSTMILSTLLVMVSMWFRDRIEEDRRGELRGAEEKYRTIVENAIDGIFQSTPDGRFIRVNPAMARMYGYDSPQEMIELVTNISSDLYVEPNLRDDLRLRLSSGELIKGFESLEYRKDGSKFWTSMNVQEIRDPYGRTLYFEGTIEDITARKSAEQILRESEERYRTLVYGMLDGIYRSSHDGRFLDVNPAMVKLFGYDSREEMLAVDIKKEMYFAPEERESLFLDTGEEKVDVFRMRRKDGSEIWVEDHGRYVHDEAGKVIYHEGILRDITPRIKSEAERDGLIRELAARNAESETLRASLASIVGTFEFTEIIRHILEQIKLVIPYDSASVWRVEGRLQKFISGVNLPAEVMAGAVEFVTDESNSAMPIIRGDVEYILNNNVQAELADFNQPPHTYVNSWLAIPMRTRGKIIGLIALDGRQKGQFTEHHAALAVSFANQVAVALENARLFNELQSELFVGEKLIQALESKNAELERFTYTVSHDLKSPLVTINGFLGYLEKDAKSGNVKRLKGDVQRIRDAVTRMHRLLSELLELSRIGRLMNQPEMIPFDDLVRETLEIVHGRLEARGVTVQTQPNLPMLYGDRQRLLEVMQNLIDNAAKFMGDQPDPRIEIGQRGHEDGKSVFFVKDNGIGIAREYHERIFGLFDKLDSNSEGTGIGLALVKRIIEVHSGRIWVESDKGQGSTFCFTLAGNADNKA